MTDSFALLADPVSRGKRTMVLKTSAADLSARADVMASDRELLLIRLWLGEDRRYVYLVLDASGSIPIIVRGLTDELTYPKVRRDMAEAGYRLRSRTDDCTLRADYSQEDRGVSVLRDDAGGWSMRVKALLEGALTYVQVRVEHAQLRHCHLVVNEVGSLVAFVTGGNDADAWDRLRGELRRRGISVD
jgi:hypothetical protein